MNKSIKMMMLCGLLLVSVSTKPFELGDAVWGAFCFTTGVVVGGGLFVYTLQYDKEFQKSYLTDLAKENPQEFAELVAAASIAAAQQKIAGK